MSNEAQRAAALAAVVARDSLLDELEMLQRAKAEAEAYEARLLAKLAAWRPTGPAEERAAWGRDGWIREEVAAALRIAPQTAGHRLARATTLVDQLPATLAALERGVITAGHANAVIDSVFPLDVATSAQFERRVLTNADSTSVSEFRARCRRTVITVDPEGAEHRRELVKATRSVSVRPGDNGMGELYAHLDQATLARIDQRVKALADAVLSGRADSDTRTTDAVRADVFADLLTGRTGTLPAPASGRATRQIQVTIAFSTLAGLNDLPGEIDHEAAPAALARELATDPKAWWRPVLVERNGHLEAVGSRSYVPSAALRRHVQLHDLTCQFPGCRRRAETCELDHAVPFDRDKPDGGGTTDVENLHVLCKRHHRLKHEAGWTVLRKGGVTTWFSPAGRVYTKINDGYLTAGVKAPVDDELRSAVSADSDNDYGSDPPPF